MFARVHKIHNEGKDKAMTQKNWATSKQLSVCTCPSS